MQLAGCLLLAGVSLLALPAVLGVCPPKDRIMISGWFEFGRACIGISHRIRMTFDQANMYCNRYGGNLYALDSPHKNRIMLSYLTTVFGQGRRQKFWTGYYKPENAFRWQWSTGSTSPYTDWEPGKPSTSNEPIGAVAWGGTYRWSNTWQDEPLSASFAFICQAPAMTAGGDPYPPPTINPPMQPTYPGMPGVPGAGPGTGPGFNPGTGPGFNPGTGPGFNPGFTPGFGPGGGAGPGPNRPIQPGFGPVNPRPGGPVIPGAGPFTPFFPGSAPVNPGAGPVNPGVGPRIPGTGPMNPRTGPGTGPTNPRRPAFMRQRAVLPYAQRLRAIP